MLNLPGVMVVDPRKAAANAPISNWSRLAAEALESCPAT
jgi:hypothetical protein